MAFDSASPFNQDSRQGSIFGLGEDFSTNRLNELYGQLEENGRKANQAARGRHDPRELRQYQEKYRRLKISIDQEKARLASVRQSLETDLSKADPGLMQRQADALRRGIDSYRELLKKTGYRDPGRRGIEASIEENQKSLSAIQSRQRAYSLESNRPLSQEIKALRDATYKDVPGWSGWNRAKQDDYISQWLRYKPAPRGVQKTKAQREIDVKNRNRRMALLGGNPFPPSQYEAIDEYLSRAATQNRPRPSGSAQPRQQSFGTPYGFQLPLPAVPRQSVQQSNPYASMSFGGQPRQQSFGTPYGFQWPRPAAPQQSVQQSFGTPYGFQSPLPAVPQSSGGQTSNHGLQQHGASSGYNKSRSAGTKKPRRIGESYHFNRSGGGG